MKTVQKAVSQFLLITLIVVWGFNFEPQIEIGPIHLQMSRIVYADTVGPIGPASPLTYDYGSGTVNWTNEANISVADANYSTASLTATGVTSEYLIGTEFGFSLPIGSTINGIQADILRKEGGLSIKAAISDALVLIVRDGSIGGTVATNKASATAWPATEAYATYGGVSDLWGETWTADQINASLFGVALVATNVKLSGGGAAESAEVNFMRITVDYTPPSPYISQTHYRWRNDDGTEEDATWKEDLDTFTEFVSTETMRLRVEIANTGGARSGQSRLEYGVKSSPSDPCTAIGSWVAVPATATTEPFEMTASTHFADGDPTTNVAGGLLDSLAVFVAGEMKETSGQTGTITLGYGEFTEVEYSLHGTSNSSPGTGYCFRIADETGTPLSAYDVYAETNHIIANPILHDVPFDNQRVSDATPDFEVTKIDAAATNGIVYQLEWDDDTDLDDTPLGSCESSASCGVTFINTEDGGDLSPFTQGQRIRATLDSALSEGTYYWRIRAKDVDVGVYSAWTTVQSFSVYLANSGITWFQTDDGQFESNTLYGLKVTGTGSVTRFSDEAELLTDQSETTWGTGQTNPGDPYNTYYHDGRTQGVYLASDLLEAGLVAGTIVGVQFKGYEQPGSATLANFRVRMKQTTSSTVTEWEGGWTDTYGPVNVDSTTVSNGVWNTYTLTTPFAWDGESNIMIDISRDDTAYVDNGGMYRRTVGSNRVVTGYCDSCTPDLYTRIDGTDGSDNMAAGDFLPSIKVMIEGAATGTMMSVPLKHSWFEAEAENWTSLNWEETENSGNVILQVYHSVSTDCDTIIPDVNLAGNSTGFDSTPINLSTLDPETYPEICIKASITGDASLEEWSIRTARLSQNNYRWYIDNDVLSPVDPWGDYDLAENTPIMLLAEQNPPNQLQGLRLRMNLLVNQDELLALQATPKLQFKLGTDEACDTGEWIDVGLGQAWEFATSSIADGTELTTLLLADSDVAGPYVKSSPAPANPNSAVQGQNIEYDFHIVGTNASSATKYSFRFINPTGCLPDSFNNCPTLRMEPGMENFMRHGAFFTPDDGVMWPYFWAD